MTSDRSAGQIRLQPDPVGNSVSLTAAGWPELALAGLTPAITVDGVGHVPDALTVTPGPTLSWQFEEAGLLLEQRPTYTADGLRVESLLHNRRDAARVLNRVTLLATGKAQLGSRTLSARVLVEGGYAATVVELGEALGRPDDAATAPGEDQAQPERRQPRALSSQMVSVAYSSADGAAFLAGFDSFRRWVGQIEYSREDEALSWAAGFDGGDLLLEPNETLELESLVFMVGDDPWALWQRFIDEVAAGNGITSLERPPVTWCSWYPYRLGVDEGKTLAQADIAAARLTSLGLSTLLLDLGWQEGYLPGAVRENDQFAHGLAWLAERLAERGLKLGCWLAPYTVSEFDPVAREHPEWLLADESGKPQSLGSWFWTPHGETYSLDLTHPGAQDYLRRTVSSMAQRGVRYLKNDFMGCASSPRARGRHDRRMVAGGGIEASRIGSRIIVEAMREGDEGALVLSGNPYEPAALGHCNLLYSCVDTGNSGFVGWSHLRDCYTTVAVHMAKNGRWGIIQPSCLVIGLPGTLEEARLRATATFLSGGQVDIGDDLTALSEERWQVLTATLPSLGLSATPVDLFEPVEVFSVDYNGLTSGSKGGLEQAAPKVGPRVWQLSVTHEGERWDLVALFEYDPPERNVAGRSDNVTWFRVPKARLGLDPQRRYWAYEFWGGQFLGELPGPRAEGDYTHPGDVARLLLPAEPDVLEAAFFGPAVKLLVLREAKDHPWPVGTTFHQSGGTELEGVIWDAAERLLQGTVARPAGQCGTVTIAGALPGIPGVTVAERPVTPRPVANGGLAFDVHTEGEVTEWEVRW